MIHIIINCRFIIILIHIYFVHNYSSIKFLTHIFHLYI